MTGSIVIRDYCGADTAALLGLVLELQAYEGQWYDRVRPASDMGLWYVEDLLAQCAKDQGAILIAERDGQVVGYAVVYVGLSTAGSRDEVEYRYGQIGDLYVIETSRGAGIGSLLLTECEARTRAAGVVWLTIRHDANNTRPARLYENLGFRTFQVVRENKLD